MSVVSLLQQFQRELSSLYQVLGSRLAPSSGRSSWLEYNSRMLLMSTPGASCQIVHQPAVPVLGSARRTSLWLRVNICFVGRA
jgi:hypothetical protein